MKAMNYNFIEYGLKYPKFESDTIYYGNYSGAFDVAMTGENADVSGDPYIVLKYTLGKSDVQKQKIPKDLANLVTFYRTIYCRNLICRIRCTISTIHFTDNALKNPDNFLQQFIS